MQSKMKFRAHARPPAATSESTCPICQPCDCFAHQGYLAEATKLNPECSSVKQINNISQFKK